jgi:hypothetical protein
MPIYAITAKDGREFEMEGNRQPTLQEIQAAYESLTQRTEQLAEVGKTPTGESSWGKRALRAVVTANPVSMGAGLGEFLYNAATAPARTLTTTETGQAIGKALGESIPAQSFRESFPGTAKFLRENWYNSPIPTASEAGKTLGAPGSPMEMQNSILNKVLGAESNAQTAAGRVGDAAIGALSGGGVQGLLNLPGGIKSASDALGQIFGGVAAQTAAETTNNPIAALAAGAIGQKAASGVGSAATQAKTRLLPESSLASPDVLNAAAGKDLSKNLRQEDINALSRIQQNASYDVSQDATGKMVPFNPSENNPLGLNAAQQAESPLVNALVAKVSQSPKSAAIASDEMVAQQAELQKLQDQLVAQTKSPDVKTLEQIGAGIRTNVKAQIRNLDQRRKQQISALENYPISRTNDTVGYANAALSKELQKIDLEAMGVPMPDILTGRINNAGELAKNMPDIYALGQSLYKNNATSAKKALDSYISAVKSSLPEKAQRSLDEANRLSQDRTVLSNSKVMQVGDYESAAFPRKEGKPGALFNTSDEGLAAGFFSGKVPAIDDWKFLRDNLGDVAAKNAAESKILFDLSQANSIPELKSAIARYNGLFSAAPELKDITARYSKGLDNLEVLAQKLNPDKVPLSVDQGGIASRQQIDSGGYLVGGYAGTLVSRLFTGRGPEFQNAVNDRVSAALKGRDPELASKIFAIASKYKNSGLKGQTLDALKNDFNKLIESTSVTIGSNQDLNLGEK